jgi:hypothetical protein
MNFSQAKPPVLEAFSACFEHDEDGVVVPPSTAVFLEHRKKFLDPSAISFSSLSKPGPPHQKQTNHIHRQLSIVTVHAYHNQIIYIYIFIYLF